MDYGQRDSLLDVYPRDSFDKLVVAGVTGDESGVRTNMEAGLWLQVVRRWIRVWTTAKAVHTHPYRFLSSLYLVSFCLSLVPPLFSLSCTPLHTCLYMWGPSENSLNSRGLVVGTTDRVPLKHRRVMKKRRKVESKSRDCESAFEKFSDPAGIPLSSKLEAIVELAQTGIGDF